MRGRVKSLSEEPRMDSEQVKGNGKDKDRMNPGRTSGKAERQVKEGRIGGEAWKSGMQIRSWMIMPKEHDDRTRRTR